MTTNPPIPDAQNLHTVETRGYFDPHWRLERCSHDLEDCRRHARTAMKQLAETGGRGQVRIVSDAPTGAETVPWPLADPARDAGDA